MRHLFPRVAVVLALLSTLAWADSLPVRKPLVLDTVLVNQGKPNAVIIVPDAPEYQKLAQTVREFIQAATAVELPIRKDSEFANLSGEPKGPMPDANTILIGNQESSGLVTYLCLRTYCSVDTAYPGKGGYIVKTIHDPWGTGNNVILLTGSNFDGVSKAVSRFQSMLPNTAGTIPRTFDAQFSKEALKANPSLSTDLSDEEIKKQVEDAGTAYRNGVQAGVFNPINYAATNYLLSGKECYAKLFRELVFLASDLTKEGQGSFGGEWGAAADFLFGPFINGWDNVEESQSLSDADRQRILAIILDYIATWEEHGYSRGLDKPMIRNNHVTFQGQGWLAAGHYFGKYFDTPKSQQWMQMADWCFQHQMKSFKSQEDCGGYQWITLRHMGRYATTRPDYSWYHSGKARSMADLAIMETDNLGYHISFGDVGGFSPASELAPLSAILTVDRDGRWAWAIAKARKALDMPVPGALAANIAPVEPTDLLGVKCMPTDPLFHAHFKGAVPQERTFDKITFRTSFDADKPYMIVDGINGCYHGHFDGNSILRFTDRGRIWLADSDYIKSLPKFHNSMLVFQNGQSSTPPTFCEKELVADLESVGMTSTTTHDYGGTDWTRNIIWDKDRTFVIIDEVKAQTTADYSFRCHWQTLGEPELNGNLYRVSQKGPSFSIRNLDGARLRCSDDPAIGQNWKTYKYAEPVVHVLQQIRTQKLPAGRTIYFLNVLSTEAKGETPVQAQRVSDSSVLIGVGEKQALVGVYSGSEEIVPGVKTDARMYRLTRDRIAVGDATYLTIGGETLWQSSTPASAEISLPQNIVLPKPHPVSSRTSQTSQTSPTSPTGLTTTAEFSKARITAMAADADGIYAGSTDGKVHALTTDAKSRWTFDAGSEVRAVWVGKLGKDEPKRIAVGTVKSKIYLLDESGNQVWIQELPYFKRDACVVYFTSADLAGDGNRALIVGSENWHVHAFDAKGSQVWWAEVLHAASDGVAADLDGDGREEVISGTEYYFANAIKPDGQPLWMYRPVGPHINCVAAGDTDGDGKPTAFIGGADGYVHAVDGKGMRRWLYGMGDEVTCMGLSDVNGDGIRDIVAGSLGFDVAAIKGDGTAIWRRDLGEPVLSLVLADLDGDNTPEICAGTEDGHVFALDKDGQIIAKWSTDGPVRKLVVVPGTPARIAAHSTDGRVVLLEMQ